MEVGARDTASAAAEAFVAELQHWRDVAGLAKKALSERMGYDPSYVGKIESGGARPSADFAKRADHVLQAGGAILRRWHDYDATSRSVAASGVPAARLAPAVESLPTPSAGLVVEHDHAELHYLDGRYQALQRRKLRNVGSEPVSRYLIRISVDRYPGDPERSNELYREHPLSWSDLGLFARCRGDEMDWRVKHDRDAFKEIWLLFENRHGHFPLYPGESVWIEYGYTVGADQWGQWFQRAVRLPTRRLSVQLAFPTSLQPAVWGMETSMTAEALPFRTAIQAEDTAGTRQFTWAVDDPPLHARYRLEWNFRAAPAAEAGGSVTAPSERMAAIGIVQDGDPILRRTAVPFALPAEAETARRVVAELHSAINRAAQIHHFANGMGVAAPQLGISRAAAVVRTPDGALITLLNPQFVEESPESDERYEGCWSFFDVRGKVPRPLAISVEHQDIDGRHRITIFERGVARLVAHEIDHLAGTLYTDRMTPGTGLLPISEYRGTGSGWTY